jgi:pimeloyl-ACP methyl ester carboxylesterase
MAQGTIATLVAAVRQLPETDSRRLALFGHSRGGGVALNYILQRGDASAIVIDSAGYPDDVISKVSHVTVPVLIFHGTLDSPTDGGSEMTAVQRARSFEAALRREQRTVEAKYYDAGHNGIFTSSSQFTDEVERAISFLRTHPPDSRSLQPQPPSGTSSPNKSLQPAVGRPDE